MKKSRYEQKISLWKNIAMTSKSRYEKISLCTKKLAMKKSRYEQISPWRNLAMQLCYRFNLSTYALYLRASPLRQFVFAIFLLIRVSQYPFAPCVSTYMFNKASVNVSCFGIPDLQLPRHAIEPELCPPHSALPQQVGHHIMFHDGFK